MNLVPSHITINNFEIDEDKRKHDAELRKKYEKPNTFFSILSTVFIGIFFGLVFFSILSPEYMERFFHIFCIIFFASGFLIFPIVCNRTEHFLLNTYTQKEYDILDNEKRYWNTVKDLLKKDTTLISVYPIKKNKKNVLDVTFLDINGTINNKKFELSNSQIKFDNIPYEVIDLTVPKFTKNDHNQNDAKLSNDYITVTLPLHCFPVYTDQICKENLKDDFE